MILSILLALAATGTPAPAAGVLVSLKAPVRVERSGSSAPAPELGMRLMKGDVVVVGKGGSAMLYLAGGGIEKVGEGGRFELSGTPPKKLSSSMKAAESGLWVLNDPSGSILVAGMRGDKWDEQNAAAAPLSPRYETAVTRKPRFYASGVEGATRIALTAGKDVIWRSGKLTGSPPWSFDELPELEPEKVYRWRLESEDGSSLSEWVPFRVPSAADADANAAFEAELTTLDGSAADVLRCGRYLENSSWTALLGASTRLLKVQPDSTVAKRAKESAERGLRLAPEQAAILAP